MSYVHVSCLNHWRKVSSKRESYYQCDQCKYHYNLDRPWVADILSSRYTIVAASLLGFASILYLSGRLMILLRSYIGKELEELAPGDVDVYGDSNPLLIGAHIIGSITLLCMAVATGHWRSVGRTLIRINRVMDNGLNFTRYPGDKWSMWLQWLSVSIGVGTSYYSFYGVIQTTFERYIGLASERILEVT